MTCGLIHDIGVGFRYDDFVGQFNVALLLKKGCINLSLGNGIYRDDWIKTAKSCFSNHVVDAEYAYISIVPGLCGKYHYLSKSRRWRNGVVLYDEAR